MPDPYINKLLDQERPCKEKSDVRGKLNCILHARADQRGLELCPYPSRAVLRGEIHEVILTQEAGGPGNRVDKISYLGYFEVEQAGVLWVGDTVRVKGKPVGTLIGYDLTHFPNHMNIIIHIDESLYTGYEAGMHPGDSIEFIFA